MPTPIASNALQLWTAVRGFSDAQLRCIETRIHEYFCSSISPSQSVPSSSLGGASNLSPTTTLNCFLQLQLDDKVQSVHVDDFVNVFLSFLHQQIQLHTDAQGPDIATTALVSETKCTTSTTSVDDHMATFDPHSQTFENEFPQLTPIHVAPKSTKRRITTTLLTCKEPTVVARPMPPTIAFPPLKTPEGTTRSPTWAKRSLLEKRMATLSSTVRQSTEQTKYTKKKPTKTRTNIDKERVSATGETTNGMPEGVKTTSEVQKIENAKTKEEDQETGSFLHEKGNDATSRYQHIEGVQINHSVKRVTGNNKAALTSTKQINVRSCQLPAAVLANSASTKTDLSSNNFAVNTQAAKLYGYLIRRRFVEKTCAELQILIGLLYRADCTACRNNQLQWQNVGNNSAVSLCVEQSEFCWRTHCLDFAEIVFQEIEDVLMCLGDNLVALVKQSLCLAERTWSNKLLERLDLSSRRREELRVTESARIGCQLPVEMRASAVRDFTIPFNEEIDSRLHYRTQAESLLYANREKIRDLFLRLLRQFQQKQHSLVGIETAGVAVEATAAARKLLVEVSPENKWWFANFFVQELIQIGANPFGESDKDLLLKIMEDKLVVRNPDRLRKLHRRFSSQKLSTKILPSNVQACHRSPNVSSNSNTSAHGNNSRWNRSDVQSSTNEVEASKTSSAALNTMRRFFTDNQLFFLHFLRNCDSYDFSQLVKHQLVRQFYVLGGTSAAAADARLGFTEVVLKLKVVAKFLGYLRFSPQWQVTSSIRELSAQNVALKAIEREGIDTLEVGRGSNFDVKQLLETSILQASIAKCIPWLCDYLSMLSLDRLSLGTTYFKQLLLLLQRLYRSPLVDLLGETGLYIALQIERILQVLNVDEHQDELRSPVLLPSDQVCNILASGGGKFLPEKSVNGAGEDYLPFLYNQVFIQSCVSELEDLREFLQTQAQRPLRRKYNVGGVGKMAAGQMVAAVRKLRPLQVMIKEGTCSDKNVSLFTDSTVLAAPHRTDENDKLSEALFKVHPKMKAVVDFVAGTLTKDVCEHVITRIVTPRADALVDRCASDSGLLNVKKNVAVSATLDERSAIVELALFHKLLTTMTSPEANLTSATALQEALCLGEKCVNTAIAPFMPSSHPTLIKSITSVALQRTRSSLIALVPKNAQAEFIKRVAWREKGLLKNLYLTAKSAVASLSCTIPVTKPYSGIKAQVEKLPSGKGHPYLELRRHVALISKSANHDGLKKSSLAEWESQVVALSSSLSQFSILLNDCIKSGDFTRDPGSPLSVPALVIWDIIWRGLTSCLTFIKTSITIFDACKLLLIQDGRATSVDNSFVKFVAIFAILLKVIGWFVKKSPRRDTILSRLQPMITFVGECVMQQPSPRSPLPIERHEVPESFVIRARLVIAEQLREVVSPFLTPADEATADNCA
uniref:Uncharacterized protein n=1 Tax=Hyaloperonospora arabidopsidis (strain Emoy2) TaxID=559515 RepID=M4BMV3_HYAAE